MVTLNPARQLGIDKRVGSIEVGKDADLAIFKRPPLLARHPRGDDAGRRQRDTSIGKDLAARSGATPAAGGAR